MAASVAMDGLLDKMRSTDSDVRYMALSDLASAVAQRYTHFPIETSLEISMTERVLELLNDTNSEVKNLAVTTLGGLSLRVQNARLVKILHVLCDGVRSENEEQRDICALGIRTLLSDMQQAGDKAAKLTDTVVQTILPFVAAQMDEPDDARQTSALDVLNDVLTHAGQTVVAHALLEQAAADALLTKLMSRRTSLVRRSMQGLGTLCRVCRASTYDAVLDRGLAGLRPPYEAECAAVQLLGVLARDTPQRMRRHAPQYVRDMVAAIQRAGDKEKADEFCETCLVTLQALVRVGHMDADVIVEATHLALVMLAHDPNAMDMAEDDDELELDDDVLADYSDDDDVSWRVRRAAARTIGTLFENEGSIVAPLAPRVAAALASRLNEREETVRLEALAALMSVLRMAPQALGPDTSLVDQLCTWRGASAQVAALEALVNLVAVLKTDLPHGDKALQMALSAVQDDVSTMHHTSKGRCMAGLALLKQLCICQPSIVLQEVGTATDVLATACQQSHHRTAIEALDAATQLLWYVAPHATQCAERMCEAVCTRLERTDTDASVRDAALVALDAAVCSVGENFVSLTRALDLIYARLSQEITWMRCVNVVHDITTCEKVQALPAIHAFAQKCLPVLADLSRHRDGAAALQTLHSVAVVLQRDAQPTLLAILSRGLPATDAPTLPPTLSLAALAVQCDPSSARQVSDMTLPKLLHQLDNLPPPVLNALFALLTSFASADESLAPALVSSFEQAWDAHAKDRAAPSPLVYAQCLGAVASAGRTGSVVLARVEARLDADETAQVLAQYTVGVLGQHGILSGWPQAKAVYDQIHACEGASRSFALGGMVLSDACFFDSSVAALRNGDMDALRILREALTLASDGQVREMEAVWEPLASLAFAEHAPDLSAECMARITLADARRLSDLAALAQSPDVHVRSMALGAVRTILSLDRQRALVDKMRPFLGTFLERLGDPELVVRRAAIMVLHAAANSCPDLIVQRATLVLSFLYEATVVREDLKRKVLMGPFTVVQDDGLDLRKNAFETLFKLIDTCLECMQGRDVLECVLRALSDDDSVKLLGCLMLLRLADLECADLLHSLESIVPKLQVILTRKLRDNATKQEVEKASEITHAVLRVLARLAPLAPASPALTDLLTSTRSSPHGEALVRLLTERDAHAAS